MNKQIKCIQCTLPTPIGYITVTESELGVIRVDFDCGQAAVNDCSILITGRDRRFYDDHDATYPDGTLYFDSAGQLKEYFEGKRTTFELPYHLRSKPGTFHDNVYLELAKIPYGSVITYAELAKRAGSPKAFRASGNANAKNMLPIFLPCHRVIAVNEKLGGYSGGLDKKIMLLNLEKAPVKF